MGRYIRYTAYVLIIVLLFEGLNDWLVSNLSSEIELWVADKLLLNIPPELCPESKLEELTVRFLLNILRRCCCCSCCCWSNCCCFCCCNICIRLSAAIFVREEDETDLLSWAGWGTARELPRGVEGGDELTLFIVFDDAFGELLLLIRLIDDAVRHKVVDLAIGDVVSFRAINSMGI